MSNDEIKRRATIVTIDQAARAANVRSEVVAHIEGVMMHFHVEAADRSVGIMSEGFSAWDEAGTAWCNLVDMGPWQGKGKFEWFGNESGEPCERPTNADVIEKALHGFAHCYYDHDDEDDRERERAVDQLSDRKSGY
jgi:lysyl-tRNA synthetase class II